MHGRESRYEAFLEKLSQDHLRRNLTDVVVRDARMLEVGGRSYVNLASNDYLGLRFHEALIERACAWATEFGTWNERWIT